MAKVNGNLLTMDLTGMIGKQLVFKSRLGTKYAAAAPCRDPNKPLTENQQAYAPVFKRRVAVAKALTKDPDKKKIYQSMATGGQSAYNVAFIDVSYPPEILRVHTSGYHGRIGDVIFMEVKDEVMVTVVAVHIVNSLDELIEHGDAVMTNNQFLWMYSVAVENFLYAGCKLIVKAYDLAGNETQKSFFI
jgi:hypothetical protein